MDNTFGHIFRCTTFGESHGGAVGVVIDGCPAGHKISLSFIQKALDRRRPGQSHLASPRAEADEVVCLSGMVDEITLGTPITLLVKNKDAKKQHYSDIAQVYRPSHADYTTDIKFGVKAPSGGGRASARETIGRVAAAAVAEQLLAHLYPEMNVIAWVDQVKDIYAKKFKSGKISREQVDETPMRCPDKEARADMEALIIRAKKAGDSVGGAIYCEINNLPPGIGAPVFDKLEAELARAMMSLPASKGFTVGSGFASTELFGSEHNDAFMSEDGKITTKTNRSGGIQGGISNGACVYMRVAFKPVATIFKTQESVDRDGKAQEFKPKAGRHDPCVLPRAVPMVEAMAILTITDHVLRQLVFQHARGPHKI